MKKAIIGGLLVTAVSTTARLIAHEFGVSWQVSAHFDDVMGGIAASALIYQCTKFNEKHASFEDHIRNAYQIIRFIAEFEVEHKEYLMGAVRRFEQAIKVLHGESDENVVRTIISDVSKTFTGGTSRDSHVRDASESGSKGRGLS